jgi:hypothetical protein
MGHHLCGSDGASERASASPAWRGFSGSESASPARISISGIAQLLQGGVSVSRVEPASPRRSRHLQSRARFSGMARLLHARVRFSGLEKLLQRGAASPGRSPLLQIRSGFSKLARLLHARVSFFGLDRLLQRGATSPQQGRPLQGRAGFSNLERLLHGIVSLSRAEPIAAAAIWLAPIPPSRKGDRSLTVKSRTFVPRRIMAPSHCLQGVPGHFGRRGAAAIAARQRAMLIPGSGFGGSRRTRSRRPSPWLWISKTSPGLAAGRTTRRLESAVDIAMVGLSNQTPASANS